MWPRSWSSLGQSGPLFCLQETRRHRIVDTLLSSRPHVLRPTLQRGVGGDWDWRASGVPPRFLRDLPATASREVLAGGTRIPQSGVWEAHLLPHLGVLYVTVTHFRENLSNFFDPVFPKIT